MNSAFDALSVADIIKPDEIYVFSDVRDRNWDRIAIEYLYIIRREEDILAALDMEFGIVLAESYEVREVLWVSRISDDCYEFKILCYGKDEGKEVEFEMYLQRILKFEEKLCAVKRLFLSE